MNTIAKKQVGVIFGTLAFLVFVALVVCLPRTSYAAALGTESPNVYCTYTDSNGKQYDGDASRACRAAWRDIGPPRTGAQSGSDLGRFGHGGSVQPQPRPCWGGRWSGGPDGNLCRGDAAGGHRAGPAAPICNGPVWRRQTLGLKPGRSRAICASVSQKRLLIVTLVSSGA